MSELCLQLVDYQIEEHLKFQYKVHGLIAHFLIYSSKIVC